MIPTRVGQKFEGGHFAGVIRVGSTCYAIIVAPKSTQVLGLQFKTSADAAANTQSVNDGWANSTSMNNPSHPAVQYCCNMAVGGYTDWYLPSRDELSLCYRYLKPTTESNYIGISGSGNLGLLNGTNSNSIPVGAAYTTANPTRTNVTTFQTGGVEAFDTDFYWTSTEYSSYTSSALVQYFYDGIQYNGTKTNTSNCVRATRRVLIAQGD